MEFNHDPENFDLTNTQLFKNYLDTMLKSHNVNGISGALIHPTKNHECQPNSSVETCVVPFIAGKSNVEINSDMSPTTWLQFASISKTVGTVYGIELLSRYNISLDSKVNEVLARYGSTFRLEASEINQPWGEEVNFRMLLSHTAELRMHYVKGIPLDKEFPSVLDLLRGKHAVDFGYPAIYVRAAPGKHFSYSGASFLVLQHVVETIEKKAISDSLHLFLQDNESKYSFDT